MKHLSQTFKKIGIYTTALLIANSPAYAQLDVPPPQGFKINSLGQFISNAIALALIVAGILVFVYLVWGGIQWITSGGDKAKTDEAKSRITAALVGLTIVATSYAVMKVVESFFGISIEDGKVPGFGE